MTAKKKLSSSQVIREIDILKQELNPADKALLNRLVRFSIDHGKAPHGQVYKSFDAMKRAERLMIRRLLRP